MTLLIFALIVPFLGGLIALFADRWGRQIGKKRLTIFKLRPKTTAEILIFLAGFLIPLMTLLAVMVISADVRKWLVEGPQVLADRDNAIRQNKRLDDDRKKAQSLLDDTKAQLARLDDLRKTSEYQLKTLRGSLADFQKRYEAARARLVSVQGSLAGAKRELASLQTSKAKVESDLARLDGNYKKLVSNYNAVLKRNQGLEEANSTLEDRIAKGETDLKDLQRAAKEQEEQNKSSIARYQLDIETAKVTLDETRTSLALAQQNLNLLQNQLYSEVGRSRFRSLIYQRGEEVARLPVAARLDSGAAASAVTQFLTKARNSAEARGAQSNKLPSAFLYAADGKQGDPADLISRVTDSADPLLIIATSTVNTFDGEPVAMDVKVFSNPLVYRNGQVIAETRVDGTKSETAIFAAISKFIQRDVDEKARQAHLILVASMREPAIQVTTNEIIDLVRLIKLTDRSVRLYATADGDTRASGPLKLAFNFR